MLKAASLLKKSGKWMSCFELPNRNMTFETSINHPSRYFVFDIEGMRTPTSIKIDRDQACGKQRDARPTTHPRENSLLIID